ncbi:hypothetical protein [Thalassoglobus sp.]|uniref:hypothetical protein n=1 Tax=Thalassoglobus sp. TaxID=2795869 RepID=UPI003AA9C4B9
MSTNRRLQQCTELEYILLGDLRDLLDEPADSETAHWLEAVLDALLDTLPEEFALKSDHGYLQDVLDRFPNWDSKVAQLEEGYAKLFQRLEQLRDQLTQGGDFQRIAVNVSADLNEWMTNFIQHHQQERELVSIAASYDVGGNG